MTMRGAVLLRLAARRGCWILILILASQVHSGLAAAEVAAPPVRVVGNLFQLGEVVPQRYQNFAYLITTPEGHILINSGAPDAPANQAALSPALIRRQMQSLGFAYADLRILLLSHAHYDHFGGHADIQQHTGARVQVMEGDDEAVRTGVISDEGVLIRIAKPCRVDAVLHDGSVVDWGGVRLTAHHTPGHTQGATTWEMQLRDGDRDVSVMILDSALSYQNFLQFHGDQPERFPDRVRLQENVRTLRLLRRLGSDVDIVLGPHTARMEGASVFERFLDQKRTELLQAVQVQLMEATSPEIWEARLREKREGLAAWATDPQERRHIPRLELVATPHQDRKR